MTQHCGKLVGVSWALRTQRVGVYNRRIVTSLQKDQPVIGLCWVTNVCVKNAVVPDRHLVTRRVNQTRPGHWWGHYDHKPSVNQNVVTKTLSEVTVYISTQNYHQGKTIISTRAMNLNFY